MKHQVWFPIRIGDQIVWVRNFGNKLPTHATVLALDPAAVTAILLDVANVIYALEAYRGAVATFPDAAYQRIEDALNNEGIDGEIEWLGFTAPAGAPDAVAYGCLSRIFTYINDTIKDADAYDAAIGADLGTEPPWCPRPCPP